MTLDNCKRLLAHYDKARKPGFTTGSPPIPLSDVARVNMEVAYREMRARIARLYGEEHLDDDGDEQDFQDMLKDELIEIAQQKGLSTQGTKAEIIERLMA